MVSAVFSLALNCGVSPCFCRRAYMVKAGRLPNLAHYSNWGSADEWRSVMLAVMKIPMALAAFVVLLAVAGCSSTSAQKSPEPSKPADAEDVSAWASVVSEQEASLAEWKSKWDDQGCDTAPVADVLCNVQGTTGYFEAQTVDITLHSASMPKAKSYIGPVPDRIKTLYSSTLDKSGAALASATAWKDACAAGHTGSGDCFTLRLDYSHAVDDLATKFAAWTPYE